MLLKKPIVVKVLTLCLILIPLVFFGYTFQKYAINIPHWDDLAVRNSLAEFLTTDSFTHKIRILFAQHNEHRIFLTRAFALFVYLIKGTLDLKTLMLMGNMSLVGILLIFYRHNKRNNLPLLALAPISFLLLNNALYENVFWGMASVQNFWVILLAFASFYFLVYDYDRPGKTYFYLAIACCFSGTFTSSNGILIPILGVGILVFQKRYRELSVWTGASILFLIFYFLNYRASPDKTSGVDFSSPGLIIKGLLAVLGNAIDVAFIAPNKHLGVSMAVGVVIIIIAVLFGFRVLWRKQEMRERNNNLFLLCSLLFLGITCVGIVAGRLSYGIEVLLTSKYKINSVLILCICYLIVLNALQKQRQGVILTGAIILGILFNFYTYLAESKNVRYLHQERIADQFKVQYSSNEMPKEGIYARLQQPAPTFYDGLMPVLLSAKDSSNKVLDVQENETGFLLINKEHYTIDLSEAVAGQYMVLRSAQRIYMFPSRIVTPSAFQLKDYFNPGFLFGNRLNVGSFVCDFTKFYLQSGIYQLGVIRVENKQSVVNWTNQSINIQAIQKQKPKQNW